MPSEVTFTFACERALPRCSCQVHADVPYTNMCEEQIVNICHRPHSIAPSHGKLTCSCEMAL